MSAEEAAALRALVERILSTPVDPMAVAAAEAARTDPWRWYCRLCGAAGEASKRQPRDEAARMHLDETPCGRHSALGWETAGRLLHVWTYGSHRPRPPQPPVALPGEGCER